jgi:hypothetical protein
MIKKWRVNMKKIIVLVLSIVVLASCSMSFSENDMQSVTLGSESTASGSVEVNVLHANSWSRGIVNGYVEVSSAPATKAVSVHYSIVGDEEWKSVDATYISGTTTGLERYFFYISEDVTEDNVSFEIYARYVADGVDYYDSNGGENYLLGSGTELGMQFVLGKPAVFVKSAGLGTYQGMTRFSSQIVCKNLAPVKDIDIIYTTDDWATTQVASATYNNGPYFNNNCEDWTASFYIGQPITADTVQFAIAYNVNGTTYWDSNFGWNYELDADGDYLFW